MDRGGRRMNRLFYGSVGILFIGLASIAVINMTSPDRNVFRSVCEGRTVLHETISSHSGERARQAWKFNALRGDCSREICVAVNSSSAVAKGCRSYDEISAVKASEENRKADKRDIIGYAITVALMAISELGIFRWTRWARKRDVQLYENELAQEAGQQKI